MSTVNLLLAFTLAAIAFWGVSITPRNSIGRKPLITCSNVVLIAILINISLPALAEIGLRGGELTYAKQFSDPGDILNSLLCVCVATGSFLLAYKPSQAFFRLGAAHPHKSSKIFSREIFITGCIVGGIALKFFALAQIGIGPELFSRLSGEARRIANVRGSESNVTGYIILASTVADAACGYLLIQRLKDGKSALLPTVMIIGLSLFTYILTGKRSAIIPQLIMPIVGYSALRRTIEARWLPLFLSVIFAFGMGSLLFRIYAPAHANGVNIDLRNIDYARGSLLDFYLFSPEFSGFDMIVRSYAQADTITDLLGGKWMAFYRANLEPFLFPVPRALWPEKPDYFYDLAHGYFVATFGGGISGASAGLAATLIGYSIVLGGPMLAAATMALLGVFSAWGDRYVGSKYEKSEKTIIWHALTILLAFQIFRQGSLGWVFLTFFQNMAPPILVWLIASNFTQSTQIKKS